MPRTLYSRQPMTRVADDLLRQALAAADSDRPVLRLCEEEPVRDLNVA